MDAPIPLGNWQTSIDNISEDVRERQEEFDAFASLKSNNQRVDFIVKKKLLQTVDWLPIYFDGCEDGHDKSESVAEVWKNKGNKFFQQKKYKDAVFAYTQACITAPAKKGNILALSFGNRSAALFYQSHYEECVEDIDRALGQGFPASSRHKVLLRKINALCKLGRKLKAVEAMAGMRQFMDSKELKLTGEQKDAFLKEIESQDKVIESLADPVSPASTEVGATTKLDDQLYKGVNEVICQGSKAITLTVSSSKGRHLLANQDIPQGSPIIVEKPFSAVLLPDHYDSHCHHCLSRLPSNSIGCHECSNVQYCNEVCRDKAWSYHKVECPYLYLLHSIGIAHLSLRTVLVAGVDFLTDFVGKEFHDNQSDREHSEAKGLNPQGVYDGGYTPVFHLMTHEDATNPQDLLQYSLTAALLLSVLLHSGHLDHRLPNSGTSTRKYRKDLLKKLFYSSSTKNEKDTNLPSDVLDIGGLLLRHILQLVCNAHAITSLESSSSSSRIDNDIGGRKDNLVEDFEQVRIATAIYPTASLMNHSCDPTIVSSFDRDILTVKTIKEVRKGDEIYNCYGPHSRRMSTADRQEVLQSQYHFVCDCPACGSQPVAHQRFGAFKCQHCAGIISERSCAECGAILSQQDMEAKRLMEKDLQRSFETGVIALKDKRFEAALHHFDSCRAGRRRLLYKDHRDLALCEDSIARCHASLGDFSLAADHLYKSVEFSNLIYGSDSVEYGHELQKLSEVLFTAERLSESLDVAQKAYGILKTSYRSGHDSLRQLEGLIMATTVGLNPLSAKQK